MAYRGDHAPEQPARSPNSYLGAGYYPGYYAGPSVQYQGLHQQAIHHHSPQPFLAPAIQPLAPQFAGSSIPHHGVYQNFPMHQPLTHQYVGSAVTHGAPQQHAGISIAQPTGQMLPAWTVMPERASQLHSRPSDTRVHTESIPVRNSGSNTGDMPRKARKYVKFSANVSTLPIHSQQRENRTHVECPAGSNIANQQPFTATDVGVPEVTGGSAGEPPKNASNEERNPDSTKDSVCRRPQTPVHQKKSTVKPESHDSNRGNKKSARKTPGSTSKAGGISRPNARTRPVKRRAPDPAGTERRMSLRSSKARRAVRSSCEAAVQALSLHKRKVQKVSRSQASKRRAAPVRFARIAPKPAMSTFIACRRITLGPSRDVPSSARGTPKKNRRSRGMEEVVEALPQIDVKSASGPKTTQPVPGHLQPFPSPQNPQVILQEFQAIPSPPQLVRKEPKTQVVFEKVTRQAVVSAEVAVPRRLPYPRPIAPVPRSPPSDEGAEEEDGLEGIAWRFGIVQNGYIWHKRSRGWLMHPSYYNIHNNANPLCPLLRACDHVRNCHEVRKRMAILACSKEGISFRESEYVWGVSGTYLQRNVASYQGKISVDFLLTPKHLEGGESMIHTLDSNPF